MTLRNSAGVIFAAVAAWGQSDPVPLSSLKADKVKVEQVAYKGKQAIRVADAIQPQGEGSEDRIALLANAGEPGSGAFEGARGFVGIAFRVAPDVSKFECFYLRPTNGRADDQVRRNHSLQYFSFPDFPWFRLRKESPEKYETYADLAPGERTRIRIEVNGEKARLFVNGVQQPALIVNDLKHGGTGTGINCHVDRSWHRCPLREHESVRQVTAFGSKVQQPASARVSSQSDSISGKPFGDRLVYRW